MSYNKSSLWQNILSPDQRWMPTQYGSFCKQSPNICQQTGKPTPETRCHELHNKVIQQKEKLNHLNQIKSSLLELKRRGDISRSKFSEALRQYPGPRKPTDVNVDLSEQPKENSTCSGRRRFNHMRGSILMFPQLQQHMKEANRKYLVTYRMDDHGGPGEARALVLVPQTEPEVAEVEVTLEEGAVEEMIGEDQEKGATEEEVGEEEVMKKLASEKSLPVRVKTPECWIDNATVSSVSGRSHKALEVQAVDQRAARSPQGEQSPQGTQEDKSHDENYKQRSTSSPNESDSTEEAPPTALQTAQARSTSENPEGTQNTQPPEVAEEPPLEKIESSSVHEPDTNTIHSWQESEKTEGGLSVTEPVPPTYICPSSSRKSHVTEIKKWLNRSTFTCAPGLLPLI